MREVIVYKPERMAVEDYLYTYRQVNCGGIGIPGVVKIYPIRILSRVMNGEIIRKRICLADDFLSRLYDDNVDAAQRAQRQLDEIRVVHRRYREANFWKRFKYLFTGIVR